MLSMLLAALFAISHGVYRANSTQSLRLARLVLCTGLRGCPDDDWDANLRKNRLWGVVSTCV